MAMLPEPFDYLSLNDGETTTIEVDRWQRGQGMITPSRAGEPPTKRIEVLRLHVKPGTKLMLPPYWDISSKNLIAGLLPYLERADFRSKKYAITKHGFGIGARFSLTVESTES